MQSKLSVLMPSDGLVLNFFREWGHSHRGEGRNFTGGALVLAPLGTAPGYGTPLPLYGYS